MPPKSGTNDMEDGEEGEVESLVILAKHNRSHDLVPVVVRGGVVEGLSGW